MQKISTIVLFVAALATAACNNPNRNGMGGAGGAGGMGGAGAIGSASDPNSAAYFAETLGDTVHFVVDQSTLTPEAQAILTKQAAWLVQHPTYTAVVQGNADEQGTREYNLALGARRAESVKQFLIANGVSGTRLKTVSYGKEQPIALCSDESCFAQNRRAKTALQAGGGV